MPGPQGLETECQSGIVLRDTVASTRRQAVSVAEGSGDVAESAPEATLIEVVEVEVPIELCGSLVDGIDDDGPGAECSAAPHAAPEGIHQQLAAKAVALFEAIDS